MNPFRIEHVTRSYPNPTGNAGTVGVSRTFKKELIRPGELDYGHHADCGLDNSSQSCNSECINLQSLEVLRSILETELKAYRRER